MGSEVTFIKTSNPASVNKKNLCTAYRLYTKDALSLILFLPINARLFSVAAPYPTLSIMIFFDKC